ncbi:hypothetical protein [Amycolatopsis sp. cmx-11-32]|uniref:hypothetical protein n=1 Tax=Amycolatopsis sp. cmx-11-32 TaxID=2785796 RepID=UPI0039E4CCDB
MLEVAGTSVVVADRDAQRVAGLLREGDMAFGGERGEVALPEAACDRGGEAERVVERGTREFTGAVGLVGQGIQVVQQRG